jgi:hypoxia up-regulated 1
MSIDLGTEFMKIAIVKPGIPMEIALNKWVWFIVVFSFNLNFHRESRRKTPVIIAIKDKDREFGDAAISRVRDY